MNKKLFSFLILFSFMSQSAQAWFGWVQSLKEGVRDSCYVLNPEWRTSNKMAYILRSRKKYKRELFENRPATQQDIEQAERFIASVNALEKGMEEVPQEKLEKRNTLQGEVDRLKLLPQDKTGKVFSGDDMEIDEGEKEGMQNPVVHIIPEDEKVIDKRIEASKEIIEIVTRSYFVTEKKAVSHEEQTDEIIENKKMRFFTSLYKFKRNTTIGGSYIFMKPYALLWIAGLTFGAYKLFKKLEIYEKFLRPNMHGLKEDPLDQKLA